MLGVTLFIPFLILFWLNGVTIVKIKKDDALRIELHLIFFSLHITKKSKEDNTQNEDDKIKAFGYLRIIQRMFNKIKEAYLVVDRIYIPIKENSLTNNGLISSFGKQGLFCALLAYLKSKADNISISDNAIVLSPDIKQLQYNLTVRIRLYQLIYALLTLRKSIKEEKVRIRKKRNVGE